MPEILVIGDIMLDQWVHGISTRISPEAPVPVFTTTAVEIRPGGAANVAQNIVSLGRPDVKVGVCGIDGAGGVSNQLRELFPSARSNFYLIDSPQPNPTKMRLLAGNKIVPCRIDQEPQTDIDREAFKHVVLATAMENPEVRLIVVADYNKGTMDEDLARRVVAKCHDKQLPLFVDAKPPHAHWYSGCSLFKPNLKEAMELAEDDVHPVLATKDPVDKAMYLAKRLVRSLRARQVIITLAEHGAVAAGWAEHVSAQPLLLDEPTGAGDVFMASLAIAAVEGQRMDTAIHFANTAAREAASMPGTVAVDRDRIDDVLHEEKGWQGKLMDHDALVKYVQRLQRNDRQIVFTNGCFDLMHPGHYSLLEAASQHGDVLIVAYNSDASVQRLKGEGRPLVDQEQRGRMLAACVHTDAVICFDEDDPGALIQELRPDVLVKGKEYQETAVPGANFVASRGGQVIFVDMLEGYSTSQVAEG